MPTGDDRNGDVDPLGTNTPAGRTPLLPPPANVDQFNFGLGKGGMQLPNRGSSGS